MVLIFVPRGLGQYLDHCIMFQTCHAEAGTPSSLLVSVDVGCSFGIFFMMIYSLVRRI